MPTNSRFAVAVHVLTLLAWAGEDQPLKSERVAASVNTNPVVIRRILCALARAGLVVSQSGACGGSRLARAPEQITLLEVYQAVEAREAFALHPHRPDHGCPVGKGIGGILADLLHEVDASIERVLAQVTIDKVLHATKSHARRRKR